MALEWWSTVIGVISPAAALGGHLWVRRVPWSVHKLIQRKIPSKAKWYTLAGIRLRMVRRQSRESLRALLDLLTLGELSSSKYEHAMDLVTQIEHPQRVYPLAAVLHMCTHASIRAEAVKRLRRIDSPLAFQVLLDGARSEEELVVRQTLQEVTEFALDEKQAAKVEQSLVGCFRYRTEARIKETVIEILQNLGPHTLECVDALKREIICSQDGQLVTRCVELLAAIRSDGAQEARNALVNSGIFKEDGAPRTLSLRKHLSDAIVRYSGGGK